MRPHRYKVKKYEKFSPDDFMPPIIEETNKQESSNLISQTDLERSIDRAFDQHYYTMHQNYEVLKKITYGAAASAGITAIIIFHTAIYQLIVDHPMISTIAGATITGVCLHQFLCTGKQPETNLIENESEDVNNLTLPFR